MVKPANSSPNEQRHWLLRRADQAFVGAATLLLLAALAGYWIAQGGLRGRLLEVDRAPRQHAQFQVDINAADWPELTQLPDIGETLARRIVESRDQGGPFLTHDDLRRVKGIGPKTLEKLRPHLLPLPEEGTVAGK